MTGIADTAVAVIAGTIAAATETTAAVTGEQFNRFKNSLKNLLRFPILGKV